MSSDALHPQARQIIEAVLEAIDIPYGASAGEAAIRERVLAERAMNLKIALRNAADGCSPLDWSLNWMREQFQSRECSLQQYETDYAKVLARLQTPA